MHFEQNPTLELLFSVRVPHQPRSANFFRIYEQITITRKTITLHFCVELDKMNHFFHETKSRDYFMLYFGECL